MKNYLINPYLVEYSLLIQEKDGLFVIVDEFTQQVEGQGLTLEEATENTIFNFFGDL
jgi:hypothetical protein